MATRQMNIFEEQRAKTMNTLFQEASNDPDAFKEAVKMLKEISKSEKGHPLVRRGLEVLRNIVWRGEKPASAETQVVEPEEKALEKLENLSWRIPPKKPEVLP